jgi:hypothetical protein
MSILARIKLNDEEEKINNNRKTYTTFSGTDFTVCVRGVGEEIFPIGELVSIHFTKTTGSVKGKMTAMNFGCDPFEDKGIKFGESEFDLIVACANEYGQRSIEEFKNVRLTGHKGGIHLDDTNREDTYLFVAEEHIPAKLVSALEFQEKLGI